MYTPVTTIFIRNGIIAIHTQNLVALALMVSEIFKFIQTERQLKLYLLGS